MERWIEEGRVSVNGAVATLGDRVDHTAQIRVDGHLLSRQTEQPICRVLMYNKPEGEMCTRKEMVIWVNVVLVELRDCLD